MKTAIVPNNCYKSFFYQNGVIITELTEQKKLYWDGEKWMKPQKDSRGSYDGWIAPLEKQPTNFKFAQEISISDLYE